MLRQLQLDMVHGQGHSQAAGSSSRKLIATVARYPLSSSPIVCGLYSAFRGYSFLACLKITVTSY